MVKKFIALALAGAGLFASCAHDVQTNTRVTDDQITISVSDWPPETKTADLERHNKILERFTAQYPNIKVVPDEWGFSIDTYLPKAASGQLPTIYRVAFTEVDRIISSGYAADITDAMNQFGYADKIKPEFMKYVTRDDRIYMIPTASYVMGLFANIDLFRQAGELNEDGSPKFPNTFEEMAQLAKKIKDKTGKAGFIMPTMKNIGGWHFMNIAWGFGAEFMKKENGGWIATFNSDECVAALQYVKDLRWEYDVLPSNALIDLPETQKQFAAGHGAMYFAPPPQEGLVTTYKMNKDDIAIGLIPRGEAGQFALMGGTLYVIRSDASPQEIDACFKWLEIYGNSHKLTEESKLSIENKFITQYENNVPIGIETYNIWESSETLDYERELRKKYNNVDLNNFATFTNFENITIRPEEPVSCQELYQTLDSCIQAVITDQNADPRALLDAAANDFQTNYLDKAK